MSLIKEDHQSLMSLFVKLVNGKRDGYFTCCKYAAACGGPKPLWCFLYGRCLTGVFESGADSYT